MKRTSLRHLERAGVACSTALTLALTLSECSSSSSGPTSRGSAGAVSSSGGSAGAVSSSGGSAGAVSSSGGNTGRAGAANGGSANSAGSPGGGSASGGALGSAGMASGGASTSLGGVGGGTAGGACPANAIFCADFESGSIPSGAVFSPAYQQSMLSMFMTVDGTTAHGGSHSLKVTPGGNFSQMLNITTGTTKFWTRLYLRQDINTNTVTGHDTFFAATDPAANTGSGIDIRVGEHECQLELNRSSDDKEILSDAVNGSSNYTCAGGTVFAPSTWYCVEAFYDGPNSSVRVFVDSMEITALHVSDWGPYAYTTFKFGFENYGGTTRTLWYDDVAVAPEQIGCN